MNQFEIKPFWYKSSNKIVKKTKITVFIEYNNNKKIDYDLDNIVQKIIKIDFFL